MKKASGVLTKGEKFTPSSKPPLNDFWDTEAGGFEKTNHAFTEKFFGGRAYTLRCNRALSLARPNLRKSSLLQMVPPTLRSLKSGRQHACCCLWLYSSTEFCHAFHPISPFSKSTEEGFFNAKLATDNAFEVFNRLRSNGIVKGEFHFRKVQSCGLPVNFLSVPDSNHKDG